LRSGFWSAIDQVARPIAWAINYTGPLAEFVKPIPVILMIIGVFAPAWGYVMWLNVALKVGEPWNYGIFAAYIFVSWIVMPALGAVIGYVLQRARDVTSE
jgi:hypothetical protein